MKEAKARIKINKLLEESGWRFFDEAGKPANIILENNTKITQTILNELGDNFEKFDSRYLPDEKYFFYAKNYFKSYITDSEFRDIIENKKFPLLNTNPNGDVFRKLPPELRTLIPEYIKDNVSLNKFMA